MEPGAVSVVRIDPLFAYGFLAVDEKESVGRAALFAGGQCAGHFQEHGGVGGGVVGTDEAEGEPLGVVVRAHDHQVCAAAGKIGVDIDELDLAGGSEVLEGLTHGLESYGLQFALDQASVSFGTFGAGGARADVDLLEQQLPRTTLVEGHLGASGRGVGKALLAAGS